MSPFKLILVVALAVSGACASARPPADSVAACQDRVASFAAWARAVHARPSNGADVAGTPLLALPGPTSASWTENIIVVAVSAQGFTVEGDPAPADGLVANLSRHGQRINKLAAGAGRPIGPHQVTLAVAAEAPWSAVVLAADALLATGFTRVQIAFAYPEAIARPGPSAVDDELRGIAEAPEGHAQLLARTTPVTERLTRGCAPAQAPVTSLDDCRCRLDHASLRAVTWAVSPPDNVWATRRTLAAAGAELALPGATPWAEAHRALRATAADETLHLVAR